MKQILRIFLIFILLPAFIYAQTSAHTPAKVKDGLTLKVHVKGLTGGTCLLANHYGDKQFIQDSAKVDASGWMTFTDSTMPGGIYLVVLPSKKYFEVVLTDVQKFTVETDTVDMVKNMKITGSKENEYFYEYLNYMAAQQAKAEPIQNLIKITHNKDSLAMLSKQVSAIDSIVKNYKRAYYKTKHPETFMAEVLALMDEPDQLPYSQCPRKADGSIDSSYNYWNLRNHYWDGMNFNDERLAFTPVYQNKMRFYLDKLMNADPDSLMTALDWLIEKTRPSKELFKYTVYNNTVTYETSKVMGYDAIFVHLVDKYYKTNQVWWVSAAQLKKIIDRSDQVSFTLLGKTAYNFTGKDTLGKLHTLQAVKAKYTTVIFWDPSCSHCKKEVPILKAYYDSLHTAGVSFEVYAIVSENDSLAWKKYIRDHNLNWINVSARTPQELANAKYYYDVYSTPTIYLLDEKKVIFGKRLDGEGVKSFMNHRIAEDRKKEMKPN